MASLPITPNIHTLSFTPSLTPKHNNNDNNLRPKLTRRRSSSIQCSLTTTFSDPFVLQLAESLEDSLPSSSQSSLPLQKLRDSSSQSLIATPWPSRKDEPFRFTDTSFIKNSQIYPVSHPVAETAKVGFFDDIQDPNVVIADGFVVNVSNLDALPDGVFVGRVSELSDEGLVKRVCENMSDFQWGDLFWSINGVGAPDVMVVYVPSGCRVDVPIHLRYLSVEGSEVGGSKLPVSNPRVVVLVENGGEVGIVEEFIGGGEKKCYWMNSVLEVVVGEGGKVRHAYVQSQSSDAAHIKWTYVRQESASSYELVEVSTGGKLSRHNLHIQQLGPDTSTELSTLHVSVGDQTQDLHSRLVLDHPRGYSQQLHKCIVAHSEGQAVFDGNVKVNRYAQQTDAGQLTRSLLLEPRATVNVKPNLQIIANDVKCSHGAAISDLEDSQIFYFLARGIDLETARKALIVSFAKEVVERLPYSSVRRKVDSVMEELLDPVH